MSTHSLKPHSFAFYAASPDSPRPEAVAVQYHFEITNRPPTVHWEGESSLIEKVPYNASLSLDIRAYDPENAIDSVELYSQSEWLCSATRLESAPNLWQANLPLQYPGKYTLFAEARDQAGLSQKSSPLALTVEWPELKTNPHSLSMPGPYAIDSPKQVSPQSPLIASLDGLRGTVFHPQSGPSPIVSFGSSFKHNTPLEINKTYDFAVYPGQSANESTLPVFKIIAEDRQTREKKGEVIFDFPNKTDTAQWKQFLLNDTTMRHDQFGLETTIKIMPENAWGIDNTVEVFQVRHTPRSHQFLYTVEATYEGKSIQFYTFAADPKIKHLTTEENLAKPRIKTTELPINFSPSDISLDPNDPKLLQTNVSPELIDHWQLDAFLKSRIDDSLPAAQIALRLASYLHNEIETIGAMHTFGTADSIAPQMSVQRNACHVLLEKQGTPIEQCALLLYLLRKSGIPSAYASVPVGNLQLARERLNTCLGRSVPSIETLPPKVDLLYPWVIAYINEEWIPFFPWIKTYSIPEYVDCFDAFEEKYNTGQKWLLNYLENDPKIMQSADTDQICLLFREFAKKQFSRNQKEEACNRFLDTIELIPQSYSTLDSLPRPTTFSGPFTFRDQLVDVKGIFDHLNLQLYWVNPEGIREAQSNLFLIDNILMIDLGLRNLDISLTHPRESSEKRFRLNVGAFGKSKETMALTDTIMTPAAARVFQLDNIPVEKDIKIACTSKVLRPLDVSRHNLKGIQFWDLYNAGNFAEESEAKYSEMFICDEAIQPGEIMSFCVNAGAITRGMVSSALQEKRYFESVQSLNRNDKNNTEIERIARRLYLGSLNYWEADSKGEKFLDRILGDPIQQKSGVSYIKLAKRRRGYTAILNVSHQIIHGLTLTPAHKDQAKSNYRLADAAALSTLSGTVSEHGALATAFSSNASVSACTLFQQLHRRNQDILKITKGDWPDIDEKIRAGSTTPISETALWKRYIQSNHLKDFSEYECALVTPRKVRYGSYFGYSLFSFNRKYASRALALISPNYKGAELGEVYSRNYFANIEIVWVDNEDTFSLRAKGYTPRKNRGTQHNRKKRSTF